MALPLSGQISMNDIQNELGISEGDPGFSDFGLSEARNGTYVAINPCSTYKPPSTGQISLSDWYGYNHTEACPVTYRLFEADEYECVGLSCSYIQSNVLVALDDTYSPNYGNFYELQAGGFYYELITEVYTGPGAILNPTNYPNCNTWCSV